MSLPNVLTRFVLIGGLATSLALPSVPALALGVPADTMDKVGAQLTSAYLNATRVSRDAVELAGKATTPLFQSGLTAVRQAVTEARRLVRDEEFITPGIEAIDRLLAKLSVDKLPANAAVLADELEIELYTLQINAAILKAEAHLNRAATALGKKRNSDLKYYLQQAVIDLKEAQLKGAYHLENDLESIEATLADMAAKIDARVPLTRESVDERIAEIHDHLFPINAND